MNGRDAALERLLDTGLEERFGGRRAPDVRDAVAARLAGATGEMDPARPRRAFVVAALMLLGVFVAGGVAWLRSGEDAAEAQEPGALDPVFPWYERDLPWEHQFTKVTSLQDLAQLPATVTELWVAGVDPELVLAVARRKGVRELQLGMSRGPGQIPEVDLWRALGAMQDLEALALFELRQISAADLRELRAAPRLRSLVLDGGCRLDAEIGGALTELPKLRTLAAVRFDIAPEWIAALAGLPDLRSLALERVPFDVATTAAIAKVRGLRMLYLGGAVPGQTLSAEQMQQIATLPRLEAMSLLSLEVDDAALRQLPPTLQAIELGMLEKVSAGGLRALAHLPRLRSLSFRGVLPRGLDAVKVELVRALPLEHFESRVAAPSPELWEALRQATKLRGLVVRCREPVGSITVECAKLLHLERLTLLCEHVKPQELPRPEHLAPLRAHPTLRQVDILVGPLRRLDLSAVQVGELRTALGPKIELVVR